MAETTRIVRNYAIPLLAVVLAGVVTLLVWPLGQPAAFVAFIAAVIVSAWQGGFRGGLVATGFSAIALVVINTLQQGTQTPAVTQEFYLRLTLFVCMGVAAGYLAMQCQRAVGAHDRLHYTLAGAGEAWIFADTQGRVTFLNPLAQAWTGWTVNQARNRPLEQLFVLLHEDSREPITLAPAQVVQQRAPQALPVDAVLLAAGGAAIPVEGSIRPVQNTDDQIVELMLTFRDVSTTRRLARELAEREARVQGLSETAPVGLMVLDHEVRCVQPNPRAQTLCGCTAEEMQGQGWLRHIQAQDRDALVAGVQTGLSEGRAFTCAVRMAGKEGVPSWLQVAAAPLRRGPNQRPSGVVVLEDVSAMKHAEATLAEARADARNRLAALEQAQEAQCVRAENALKAAQQKLEEQNQHQADAEAAHQKAITYLERQLQDQKQSRDAQVAESQALKAAADKELVELRNKLGERDRGEEQARRELANQLAEERKRRQDAEQQMAEAMAALQVKQADCDRTTEECLNAMAELEKLRQAGTTVESALTASRNNYESRICELEATHRTVLEALEQQLAASRHGEAHIRRDHAEVLQRQEQAAATHRQALQQLRHELEQVRIREQSVHERSVFQTALLDACPHGLLAYDHQQRITFWNPALVSLTGKTAAEMLGQQIESFLPGLGAAPAQQVLSWGSERIQAGELITSAGPSRRGQIAILRTPLAIPGQESPGGLALLWELPAQAAPRERPERSRNGMSASPRSGGAVNVSTDGDWLEYN